MRDIWQRSELANEIGWEYLMCPERLFRIIPFWHGGSWKDLWYRKEGEKYFVLCFCDTLLLGLPD